MKMIWERVAGIDQHRDSVKVGVRLPGADGQREQIVRTYATPTTDLLAMRDWLKALGVTHVAIESTGNYWKSTYYLLEEEFTVLLVNAAHVKHVPGKKTDTQDCLWLAELLECGLLKASLIPPPPLRVLRALTRRRKHVQQDRTREVQRLHDVLQDAGIKLSSVATNILGVSGRAILKQLVEGRTDPEALAELARGRLRAKLPELRKALEGQFSPEHGQLVEGILAHIDFLEAALAELQQHIDSQVAPYAEEQKRLDTIPGWDVKTSQAFLGECGADMKRFPTPKHLGAWSGLAPGQHQSAGKRRPQPTRHGNRYLRAALVEAAWAAVHKEDNYFSAQYHRLVGHRGKKKAIVAVAHSMIEVAHVLLSRKVDYHDLGPDYFLRRNQEAIERRCVRQLQRLGYKVTLTPQEATV
jgi:transposase